MFIKLTERQRIVALRVQLALAILLFCLTALEVYILGQKVSLMADRVSHLSYEPSSTELYRVKVNVSDDADFVGHMLLLQLVQMSCAMTMAGMTIWQLAKLKDNTQTLSEDVSA